MRFGSLSKSNFRGNERETKGRFRADIVDLVGGFAAGRFDWRSVWWWALPLSTAAEPRDAPWGY
ncbi:hypothetical protein, partial [Devosia sp.]|uniref:hypothetical protein n=1 Tax=Devosia sp. TaxID=1871048 RepID=UPI0037C015CA